MERSAKWTAFSAAVFLLVTFFTPFYYWDTYSAVSDGMIFGFQILFGTAFGEFPAAVVFATATTWVAFALCIVSLILSFVSFKKPRLVAASAWLSLIGGFVNFVSVMIVYFAFDDHCRTFTHLGFFVVEALDVAAITLCAKKGSRRPAAAPAAHTGSAADVAAFFAARAASGPVPESVIAKEPAPMPEPAACVMTEPVPMPEPAARVATEPAPMPEPVAPAEQKIEAMPAVQAEPTPAPVADPTPAPEPVAAPAPAAEAPQSTSAEAPTETPQPAPAEASSEAPQAAPQKGSFKAGLISFLNKVKDACVRFFQKIAERIAHMKQIYSFAAPAKGEKAALTGYKFLEKQSLEWFRSEEGMAEMEKYTTMEAFLTERTLCALYEEQNNDDGFITYATIHYHDRFIPSVFLYAFATVLAKEKKIRHLDYFLPFSTFVEGLKHQIQPYYLDKGKNLVPLAPGMVFPHICLLTELNPLVDFVTRFSVFNFVDDAMGTVRDKMYMYDRTMILLYCFTAEIGSKGYQWAFDRSTYLTELGILRQREDFHRVCKERCGIGYEGD